MTHIVAGRCQDFRSNPRRQGILAQRPLATALVVAAFFKIPAPSASSRFLPRTLYKRYGDDGVTFLASQDDARDTQGFRQGIRRHFPMLIDDEDRLHRVK